MSEEIIATTKEAFKPAELYEKYEELASSELKAVYALNMCTVSVSQIIDYNDTYILEQEYDAILNNLNLEVMPKDDALRNILTELLNVITFFRIQEAKKEQIEKKYQRRVKDAIWSAIPNFSVVTPVSVGSVGKDAVKTLFKANAVGAVTSIVTQVGTGYMNYRREKANAKRDKENDDFELQITAIEQFNALQRELFTTAWKLAAEHKYPDELRLTERQIKQYNQILMDPDDYRKCARLEAIQDKFLAYPPFWYMLAHTALTIAQTDPNEDIRANYREKAENCLKWYYETFCFASDSESEKRNFGLLREDQMAAAALLEYADLLLSAKEPKYEKIYQLIKDAEDKAGQANDILQLCAVAYLNIRRTSDAEKLLKILVNDGYNTISNARILSWLYAYDFKKSAANRSLINADYELLRRSVHSDCLVPLPSIGGSVDAVCKKYIDTFKKKLIVAYRLSLTQFESKMGGEFSIVPKYSSLSGHALTDCFERLTNDSIASDALSALNQTASALDRLTVFKELPKKDEIIYYSITGKLKNRKATLENLKKCGAESFKDSDYRKLYENFSYEALADSFFVSVKEHIMDCIKSTKNDVAIQQLNIYEDDLIEFCRRNDLNIPTYLIMQSGSTDSSNYFKEYFDNELLGISSISYEVREKLISEIEKLKNDLVSDPTKTELYVCDEAKFNTYFDNVKLKGEKNSTKRKTIAVIDDKTRKDYDLLLCDDGIMVVHKNKIEEGTVRYDSVYYLSESKPALMVYYPVKYQNEGIHIERLYELVKALSTIVSAENRKEIAK